MVTIKEYQDGTAARDVRQAIDAMNAVKAPSDSPQLVCRLQNVVRNDLKPALITQEEAESLIDSSAHCAVGDRTCQPEFPDSKATVSVFLDDLAIGLSEVSKAKLVTKTEAKAALDSFSKHKLVVSNVEGAPLEICRTNPKTCLFWHMKRFGLPCFHDRDAVRLDAKTIERILSKGWMTHDAMWFAVCIQELGIEKANVLNLAAIERMSPFEVKRMVGALNMQDVRFDDPDQVWRFFKGARRMVVPDWMDVTFERADKTILRWQWNSCFAYDGVMRLGVIDAYRCGVMHRIGCWLSGLGVPFRMVPPVGKCLDASMRGMQGRNSLGL